MGDIEVGGRCEDCEGVFDSPVSFKELNEIDTLPGFLEEGPKIEISGTVFKRDGITPAAGVILYVYHTDQYGNYTIREQDPPEYKKGTARQHGSIRGWVKTNERGHYKFYTLIPASYPNSRNPKHIHPTIKEEGKIAYWIDEFVFDNDPLLPASEKNRKNPKGGSGLLKPELKDGMYRATRNIILGLNVSGYPEG